MIQRKPRPRGGASLHQLVDARPGLERHAAIVEIPRHRHGWGYAALVLAGGYEEAGGQGRRRLGPGDVAFHPPFDAHLDRFGGRPTLLVNLPWPWRWPAPETGAGTVHDPERIARLAGADPRAAAEALREQVLPSARADEAWPDALAACLRTGPGQSLAGWAEDRGLAAETLSRGFGALYGVTPAAYRAEARAGRAWRRIVTGDEPLAEVAGACGFADQAHMTRAVTALTGRPPAAWRRWSNPFKTVGGTRR